MSLPGDVRAVITIPPDGSDRQGVITIGLIGDDGETLSEERTELLTGPAECVADVMLSALMRLTCGPSGS